VIRKALQRWARCCMAWGSVHARALIGAVVCLWLWLILALVLDLVHNEHLTEGAELFLAIVGGVFAFLATEDAHRAFIKAREVQEAVGSFRVGFAPILEEMTDTLKAAASTVVLLLPTPVYGYLFGQPKLSIAFVDELALYLRRESTSLKLCLVRGDKEAAAPRSWSPQQYLRRGYRLQADKGSTVRVETYVEQVARFFALLQDREGQVELYLLSSDPNVRILIADDEHESAKCVLAFAPSQIHDTTLTFEAMGFMSTRKEMIIAAKTLWHFYATEKGERVSVGDYDRIRSLFTTLQ